MNRPTTNWASDGNDTSAGVKFSLLQFLSLLAMGTLLTCVLRGQAPIPERLAPFSIRFDVGSDHDSRDHRGRLYQTDQEWTPQTLVGYIGGYRMWNGKHPTDGTLDEFLYVNQRHNWKEYRFSNIPNGDYLVTLSFSEIGIPAYTVFDVAIEGQIVLENFRISDHVGGNYALIRRFGATVNDGELNVTSRPVSGDPRLAAIEVAARQPDSVPPPAPTGLTITSSYNAVLLDWADAPSEDCDGYHVYRATSPSGPYARVTGEPARVSRYRDAVHAVHVTHYYRVSAVDAYGNESDLSTLRAGDALRTEAAALPFYKLEVPTENLQYLYTHVLEDDEVVGDFIYKGQSFPALVRYRGGYGRYVHKKSWKIKFPDESPFLGRREINLRADYSDPTLMHTKLATDLFEASGVHPPQAQHVLLMLNGKYVGVYTSNEQVDEGFLERTGQNPDAIVYKAAHTDANDFSKVQPSKQAYHTAYEKKTNQNTGYGDIIDFIELINNRPDETFAHDLRQVFDIAAYLDSYAINILISNGDFVHHNVYFLHDLDTDQWRLAPYDFDAIFNLVERPIDEGTAASPIQPRGWNSVLLTRLLDVPQFRAYYCRRLAEMMDGIFSEAAMDAQIDQTFAALAEDGMRDWHKRRREKNDWFNAGPDEIKRFVAERRRFLRSQMPAYCPADRPYLKINEVMGDHHTFLEDLAAPREFPAWFEIYNAGLETVDLAGMYLTDDLAAPDRFQISSPISIPPGGFVTFFADGSPEIGPLHTNFQLGPEGGQIGLFSGTQQIDAYTFGPQASDVSTGRYPDGAVSWRTFEAPTPGRSNELAAPVISAISHTPPLPIASAPVTVTAAITADGESLTATLYYSATGSGFAATSMTPCTQTGIYLGHIAPVSSGAMVEYYIAAEDKDKEAGGQVSVDPASAPRSTHRYLVDYRPPTLLINEFLADSASGSEGDWIELYNPGSESIDLGGLYLTDDLNAPAKFQITAGTTISAGGFLVFHADESPKRGPLHTNFNLDRRGESIGLFDSDAAGNQRIDAHTFSPQTAGVTEGRYLDGRDLWASLPAPTPGAANQTWGLSPAILEVQHTPLLPSTTEQVSVSAVIVGSGAKITPTLWYSTGADFRSAPMRQSGNTLYVAAIPTQLDDSAVAYYVQVRAADEGFVASPPSAPTRTHLCLLDYQPPPLTINEFMANNESILENPAQPWEFSDWIEIYNAGATPINLGGMYLSDDLSNPTQFQISDTLTISAEGFVIFYADNAPQRGPFHTNFRLNRYGESVGLFDIDTVGNQVVDTYTFGWQAPNLSQGRNHDGGEVWRKSPAPTPGETNRTFAH